MKLLGIDFETQGVDAKNTNPTEVGAVLYHLSHGALHRLGSVSSLLYMPYYEPQSPKIMELTGITDAMLKEKGQPPAQVYATELFPLMEQADVIFAHKKSFDQVVLESSAQRYGLTPPKKEWVCTLTEWPWPENLTCKKLSHLAYEHGIMVDPRTLHRADQDVELMMRLIGTYDIEQVLNYSREPWVYFKANPHGPWVDGGLQNAIAKDAGFGWESIRGLDGAKWPKTWVARVKKSKVDDFLAKIKNSESPFKVESISGIA